LLDRAGDPLGTHELDELLRRNGIDDRLANRMVSLLQTGAGSGQAGLSERAGMPASGGARGGAALDGHRAGRFALAGNSEWVSVNPLFANDLAGRIRHLAAAASGG